jgi:spore coat protein H
MRAVKPRFALFVAAALVLAQAWSAGAQTTPDQADPFFDDTVVHEIRLAINSRDWETLKTNFLLNDYYPCDFKWGNVTVRNVGIRSRGTGSRSGVKPGLRVDFDRYTTNQKFLGLKSFVLRNNTQDFSNLHERVSMLFFKRQGIVASREAHARLYVNNDYAGLYTIVESVDKTFLQKNFGDDSGFLYKYDYNPSDLPFYFEYKGADQGLYVPSPFKPETNESDPQPAPLVDLIRTVTEASTAVFRDQIAQYLDLHALLKHVAIEMFVAEGDGFVGAWGMNNFYIYRPQGSNQFTIIPWDKSETFKDGPTYPIFHNIYDVAESIRNRLVNRALSYPDLRSYYLDVLMQCAESAAETAAATAETAADNRGWMEREVEREFAQIQSAVQSDPQKGYSNEDFMAAVDAMRTFAQQRSAFVTAEVAKARP